MPRAAVRAREAQDEETLVGMKRSRSDLDSSELDGSSGQDEHDLGGGAGSPGRSRRTEKQQQRARNKACREKSRREFLNDCFFLLADVVGTEPPLKDKGSILRGAIKEIRALREEGARMKQENERRDGPRPRPRPRPPTPSGWWSRAPRRRPPSTPGRPCTGSCRARPPPPRTRRRSSCSTATSCRSGWTPRSSTRSSTTPCAPPWPDARPSPGRPRDCQASSRGALRGGAPPLNISSNNTLICNF